MQNFCWLLFTKRSCYLKKLYQIRIKNKRAFIHIKTYFLCKKSH
ncbi:hypothetical protein D927_01435 [Enterococcus faecalis 02-MB-BW-10]|nr:hypothetical protein D927_01435 [Enterococcus faecalis 02-MB-BW-10]